MLTTVNSSDVIAIVNSVHQNPHRVLGMHQLDVGIKGKEKTVISVRAFLPDAKQAFAYDAKSPSKEWELEKIHPDGFFEGILWNRKKTFHYKFRVVDFYGNEWRQDDPYEEWIEEITPFDRYLFNRSRHYKIYEKMGAHIKKVNGKDGVFFSVWAPNAARVSVVGHFNNWDGRKDPMELLADSGVWVLFKPGMQEGELYKYEVKSKSDHITLKSDPYSSYNEMRPNTASIVYTLEDYNWNDDEWLKNRPNQDKFNRPMSIYEVHSGSWQKGENGEYLTYRQMADQLIPYVKEMGFTHIQFLPLEEHPFDGSWGYQVTGYFAPTSRHGEPKDLQYFIDCCHQENIGVILDWVPAHFPKDSHGLANFDGTALYEHQDPRQGEHPDWGTKVYNYGRDEVKNFLISNALYWIDKFHFDGLRVDAVASMLYLDYSRKEGEWIPNYYGGRENLEAIEFLKHTNSIIAKYFPGVLMIAEESTSWPGVSKPTTQGGLGFDLKWNMGWMHDVLDYMEKDPIHRKFHHNQLTFGLLYAWSENFILPFSHDEVVHGKGSMLSKMPGDYWQKFANLRALYTYMWGFPGKKLLFMGQEFGQFDEWNHNKSLQWNLLEYEKHAGLKECVKDLNRIYKEEKALWEQDFVYTGFDGINCDDYENSILSFIRYSRTPKDGLIFVINFTPVPRHDYVIGVPEDCFYQEIFNSDSGIYGGSNMGNLGGIQAIKEPADNKSYSIKITVPPLAGLIFKPKFD